MQFGLLKFKQEAERPVPRNQVRWTRDLGAPWDHLWLLCLETFLGLEEVGEPSWGRVARARLARPQKGWDPKGQKVNFLFHERYHLPFLDEIYRLV